MKGGEASDPAIKALLLPFEQGLLAVPGPASAFLIRARADPGLSAPWRERLVCEQTDKPAYDRLQAAGFSVVPRLEGRFLTGLCLLTKHKAENLVNVARGWNALEPGGVLVCSGAKEEGAISVEEQVREALGTAGSLYKHHCRVFWAQRHEDAPAAPAAWLALDKLQPQEDGRYLTRPGLFSYDRVDQGSRLLVDSLPPDIGGTVADLGAGWGYLSRELLQRFAAVRTVDLFESELLALEAARANLAAAGLTERASFHWHDVAAGLGRARQYDWVVMNPPFHSGKHRDVGLGQSFLAAAAAALRADGSLVLVANRQLPYEATLRQSFGRVKVLREEAGFKVLLAVNPGGPSPARPAPPAPGGRRSR